VNLKEGTRRLALLLGVVGAILGGFVGYLQLQSELGQRARHNRFEQSASSPVVRQAWKSCFERSAPQETAPPDHLATQWKALNPQQRQLAMSRMTADQKLKLATALGYKQDSPNPLPPAKFIPPFCYTPIADPKVSDYTPVELNADGIKTVHFENRAIASIETQDGQTLYPTPAPGAWSYAGIALLPLLGFFIPWAAIRAIGWVLAGFVASGI
jgi:hypothetical protein